MVLVFLLTTESGDRLGYSLTIFLSFNVVLTITSDLMPTTSKELPIIGNPYIEDLAQELNILNLFIGLKKSQETLVGEPEIQKMEKSGRKVAEF